MHGPTNLKIVVDLLFIEVNHLCIKETTGDPEWNPLGLHV